MSSTRQQIIEAVATKLQEITVSNGYLTEVGARVYVWRRHPVEKDEAPCLLVFDANLRRDYGGVIGLVENLLTISITAVVASNTPADDAREIESDLILCLGNFPDVGGLANWLRVESSELTMAQHEKLTGAVSVSVMISYTSERNKN